MLSSIPRQTSQKGANVVNGPMDQHHPSVSRGDPSFAFTLRCSRLIQQSMASDGRHHGMLFIFAMVLRRSTLLREPAYQRNLVTNILLRR